MNKEEDKRRLVIIFVMICGATLKSSLSIAAYTSMENSEKEEASFPVRPSSLASSTKAQSPLAEEADLATLAPPTRS